MARRGWSAAVLAIAFCAILPATASAHCRAGLTPHKGCGNPPPRITPGINPTWHPTDRDFGSPADREEAFASYQAQVASAKAKAILVPERANKLIQQSRALKQNLATTATHSRQ